MAKLFVCGDIVNQKTTHPFVGENLARVICAADYSVCNFEGPELKPNQVAKCPHQENGTAAYLKSVGFDLMLLANNHITELGADGVQYSINTIKAARADCMGAGLSWDDAYKPLRKNIKGVKFGFINVCEAQVGQFLKPEQDYGYAWMGYGGLFDDIKALAKEVDHVVVFVHAGLEHYPLPLPEIREFYKRIIKAGASAVIGGHPHCAQGWEYYEDKLIVYSLGNFYFPYEDNRRPEENISYSLTIEFTDNGRIEIKPVHHYLDNNVVELLTDTSKQVDLNRLCNLLKADYQKNANEMCLTAYKTLCSHLLAEATCGEYEGIKPIRLLIARIRQFFQRKRYVFNTQKRRDALMLRLFENETYYWTIIRALKNKNNE